MNQDGAMNAAPADAQAVARAAETLLRTLRGPFGSTATWEWGDLLAAITGRSPFDVMHVVREVGPRVQDPATATPGDLLPPLMELARRFDTEAQDLVRAAASQFDGAQFDAAQPTPAPSSAAEPNTAELNTAEPNTAEPGTAPTWPPSHPPPWPGAPARAGAPTGPVRRDPYRRPAPGTLVPRRRSGVGTAALVIGVVVVVLVVLPSLLSFLGLLFG